MKTIDPKTCKITVKAADGRKLPARIHWSEPRKLVETVVRSREGRELATIVSPEFHVADGENFAEALKYFDEAEYDDPVAKARKTDMVRLSGVVTIDVPAA